MKMRFYIQIYWKYFILIFIFVHNFNDNIKCKITLYVIDKYQKFLSCWISNCLRTDFIVRWHWSLVRELWYIQYEFSSQMRQMIESYSLILLHRDHTHHHHHLAEKWFKCYTWHVCSQKPGKVLADLVLK